MSIGVTFDEFWHGDPEIVRFAIEMDTIRQRNESILSDVAAWNTGRYVMLAVSTVFSHAFSKSSTAKYPAEPIIAYELDEQLKEQKRERDLRKMHAEFLAVAAALPLRKPTGADAQH
jgi:hypothetical protein